MKIPKDDPNWTAICLFTIEIEENPNRLRIYIEKGPPKHYVIWEWPDAYEVGYFENGILQKPSNKMRTIKECAEIILKDIVGQNE